MKNSGLTGAIALCGVGLVLVGLGNLAGSQPVLALGTAFVDPEDLCAERCDTGPDGDLPYCVEQEEEQWFEMVPRPLCAGDGVSIGSLGGGASDYDGGSSSRLSRASNTVLDGGDWSEDSRELGAYSVRMIDGIAETTYTPITIDWTLFIPDLDEYVYLTASSSIDIDGDGRRDLIVSTTYEGTRNFYWLKNITAGSILAADVNVDGRVDGQDLALLLGEWTG